jgi:hypothetical protein
MWIAEESTQNLGCKEHAGGGGLQTSMTLLCSIVNGD